MKILITTDWYRPAANGVVTSVVNLAEGLKRLGHETRILTLSSGLQTTREGEVIRLGSLGAGRIYPGARLRTAFSRGIIRELVQWQPDAVHSQCEFSTFPLARKIARYSGAPLIHTYHTAYEDYTNYFSPYKSVGKKLAATFSERIVSHTDAVIAPTMKIARLLEGYRVEKQVYVIPSGLALGNFEMTDADRATRRELVRSRHGIGMDEPVLIYVGRLAKEKNIAELLSLLQSHSSPDWKLLLAGDGPYRGELETSARELGLSGRVIFAGMVPPERVADYYAAGDVFVSASNSETQGLTYIEAMAASLPLLCRYDECLDGVAEQGINGFTYLEPGQFREYSDRLRSEKYRRELGNAASEAARKKFSADRFASSVAEVYRIASTQKLRLRAGAAVSAV